MLEGQIAEWVHTIYTIVINNLYALLENTSYNKNYIFYSSNNCRNIIISTFSYDIYFKMNQILIFS